MTKGIMSPPANVRPPYPAERRHRAASGCPGPARSHLHRRRRPLRQTRRLLRQQAADPEPRLLQLHHALRRSSRRTQRLHEDDQVRRRQRIRRHYGQLQSEGNPRHRRREESRTISSATDAPAPTAGWHFLTGALSSINALTKAVGFQYQYDRQDATSTRTPRRSWCSRRKAASRATSTVWTFRRKICAWDWSKPRRARSATPSIRCCLYCYHYDPATGKYGAVISNILRLGAGLTILLLGGFLWFCSAWSGSAAQEPGGTSSNKVTSRESQMGERSNDSRRS